MQVIDYQLPSTMLIMGRDTSSLSFPLTFPREALEQVIRSKCWSNAKQKSFFSMHFAKLSRPENG